jgi:hypothetical protein
MVIFGGDEAGANLVRERAVVRPAMPPPRMMMSIGFGEAMVESVGTVFTVAVLELSWLALFVGFKKIDGYLQAVRSWMLYLGFEHKELYIYIVCRSGMHSSDLQPMFVYLWIHGLALTANVSGYSGVSRSAKLGNRLGNIISLACPNGPSTCIHSRISIIVYARHLIAVCEHIR